MHAEAYTCTSCCATCVRYGAFVGAFVAAVVSCPSSANGNRARQLLACGARFGPRRRRVGTLSHSRATCTPLTCHVYASCRATCTPRVVAVLPVHKLLLLAAGGRGVHKAARCMRMHCVSRGRCCCGCLAATSVAPARPPMNFRCLYSGAMYYVQGQRQESRLAQVLCSVRACKRPTGAHTTHPRIPPLLSGACCRRALRWAPGALSAAVRPCPPPRARVTCRSQVPPPHHAGGAAGRVRRAARAERHAAAHGARRGARLHRAHV